MELLTKGWGDRFYEFVMDCNSSLDIISPFIKKEVVKNTLGCIDSPIKLRVVTQCSQRNLVGGALDASALRLFLGSGASIQSNLSLHAKIFIFDKTKAVVTSANLTNGGLFNNTEVGVCFDGVDDVVKVLSAADSIFNAPTSYELGLDEVDEVDKLAISIKNKMAEQDSPIANFETDLHSGITSEIVANSLSGWRKSIFEIVTRIKRDEFDTEAVYAYEAELSELYPNNKYVRDKIRQQLQELRDLGIVEFLGNGQYKKLR